MTRSSKLSKNDASAIEFAERYKAKMVARAYEYLSHAMDGAQIDDEGPIPEEWKKEAGWQTRERLARDGRRSRRNAPMYLEMAQKLVEMDQKEKANQGQLVQLNIGAINLVRPPKYDEILVDAAPVSRGSVVDVESKPAKLLEIKK